MKTAVFSILFLCCTIGITCKQIAYKRYIKHDFIVFGSGGGFSGAIEEYFLFSNGDLNLKNSFSNDTVFIKKHSFQTVKMAFKLADSKELRKIQLNETGNMTNFIKFYRNKSLSNSYSWAEETNSLPAPLLELKETLDNLK